MPDDLSSTSPERLPRRFGFWTGTLVTVASMVGVGILTTSGFTLRDTESPVTLLVVWAFGGLLALAGALTFAELATGRPHAGGEYIFVRDAFGRGAGFVYGWATLIFGFAGPTALIAYAMSEYALVPVRQQWAELGMPSSSSMAPNLASTVIVVLTLVHCRGQRQSAWMQNATTVFKLAVLVGFVVLGVSVGAGDWSHLREGRGLIGEELGVVATSLLYVSYGYSGWNASVYLAGEMREPVKTLPRSLIAGTLMVTALYLVMNVVYVYAIEPTGLREADSSQVQAIAETAARRLWGPAASATLSGLIGLGILASVSAYLLTGPRICYAMACDRLFPRYASVVHPRWQTPVRAILTQGLFAVLLLWGSQILAGHAKAFQKLLDYTSVGLVVLMALAVAAVFPLRRPAGSTTQFRVPLYPLTPLFFLTVTGVLVVAKATQSPGETLFVLASLLSGWPIYWLSKPRRHE